MGSDKMEFLGNFVSRYSKESVKVGVEGKKIYLSIDHGCDGEDTFMNVKNAEELIELLNAALEKIK